MVSTSRKILIIGFPRSGTSLMYRIIKQHPEVRKMFFEANMLKRVGTDSENTLNHFFTIRETVGEKIIYEKDRMGKLSTSPTPVDYCKMWNKRFKKGARIIQIIRHPYDVWNSLIMKKYVNRNIKHSIPRMTEKYFDFIPIYFLPNIERSQVNPHGVPQKRMGIKDPSRNINWIKAIFPTYLEGIQLIISKERIMLIKTISFILFLFIKDTAYYFIRT